MTTIAFKDGIIAADTLVAGDGIMWGEVCTPKIVQAPYGALGGAAGSAAWANDFLRWVSNRALQSTFQAVPECPQNSADAIFVEPDGALYCWDGRSSLWRLRAEFTAIGSGAKVAMGAMAMGASAEQAVRVAAQFDVYTGGRITTLSLPSPSRPTGG